MDVDLDLELETGSEEAAVDETTQEEAADAGDGVDGADGSATENTETETPGDGTEGAGDASDVDGAGEGAGDAEGATEEPKMVPLSALQEERAERQAAQRRIKELESGTSTATPDAGAGDPAASGDELNPWDDAHDLDPDLSVSDEDYDGMLPSEIRAHDRKCKSWNQRQTARRSQHSQEQQMQQIDVSGNSRFSVDAMGENLDYETVLASSKPFLTPEDLQAIADSSDIAKTAYELCCQRNPYINSTPATSQTTAASSTTSTTDANEQTTPKAKPKAEAPPSLEEIFEEGASTPEGVANALDFGG